MQSWMIFVDFRECLANSKYSFYSWGRSKSRSGNFNRPADVRADGKILYSYSNPSPRRKKSTLSLSYTHGNLRKIIQPSIKYCCYVVTQYKGFPNRGDMILNVPIGLI